MSDHVDGGNSRLFLLEIDFDRQKCSVLDRFDCNFRFNEIILNYVDNSKFAIIGYNDDFESFIYKGHVANDRIYVEEQRLQFDNLLFHCSLTDKGFKALHAEFDHILEVVMWKFSEYEFNLDSIRQINELFCPRCPVCTRNFHVSF